ncbi:MAG: acetyl-CoA hydrolase/transferase C-terminal domain-containing protein [Candidatus Hadarchaeum sp.]
MKRERTRWVTPEEAVSHIKSGHRVVLPLCCGLPQTLMEALVAENRRLRDVEIVSGLQITYPFLKEGLENAFNFRTWQCSPQIRHLIPRGLVKYVPMRQGDAIKVFSKRGPWPVDVSLIQVSPPDRNGFCSLGVSIGHSLPLALEAPLVIAEVNKQMPRVLGKSFIHLSRINFAVETDRPLLEYVTKEIASDAEKLIGRLVAELIPDGATVQIGLGAIPDSVVDHLGDKKDLKIFGMGIDKIVDLVTAGAIELSEPPKVIITEVLGTRKIFRFVDDNPIVEGRPLTEVINSRIIGNIPKFCSVLSAIEVDLFGQVNAETVDGKQFSAIGGSFDFLQGALYSEEGRSIIAITSTTRDEGRSRIVAQLPLGSAVTTPRHCVQYVVTEYGVAELWGKSTMERAKALIEIAHPKFRDHLYREAKKIIA